MSVRLSSARRWEIRISKRGRRSIPKSLGIRGGEITRLETWGKRRLAYEIDDFTEGHYFLYRFRGVGGVLDELGRQMRIDEEIIRHMIVIDELATGDEPAVDAKNVEASVRQEKEREREREEA